jgi:hypothetical protein
MAISAVAITVMLCFDFIESSTSMTRATRV